MRLDVSVVGVPAQLENDETFSLPPAAILLIAEMGSDATFPQMRGLNQRVANELQKLRQRTRVETVFLI